MSRRRNSGYAISLFAFQDIITSVSGVLIMVVLLLALELTNRTTSKSARAGLEATATQVRAEQRRLAAEAIALEAAVRESEELIRRAAAAPASLVEGRIREAESAIASLMEELGGLESAAEQVEQSEQEISRSREGAAARERLRRSVETRLEVVRRDLDRLRSGQTIAYTVPRGIDPRGGWTCDVSGEALRLQSITPPVRQETISLKGTTDESRGGEAIDALSDWIGRPGTRAEYVLFLIRPSGVWFDQAMTEQPRALSTQVGIELIGEDHEILSPSRTPTGPGAGEGNGGAAP